MSRRPSAPCASRLRVARRNPAGASGSAPRRGQCLPARSRFLRRQGPGVRDRRPGDRRDPDADQLDRDEVPFPARSRPRRSAGSGDRAAVRGLFFSGSSARRALRPGRRRRLRRVGGHRQPPVSRSRRPSDPCASRLRLRVLRHSPAARASGPAPRRGQCLPARSRFLRRQGPGCEAAGPETAATRTPTGRTGMRFLSRPGLGPCGARGAGTRCRSRSFPDRAPRLPLRPGGRRRLRRVIGTSAAPGFQVPEAFRPLRLAPPPPGRSP